MKVIRKFSTIMLLISAIFMTGCDASQIMDVINKVVEGVQKAMPAIKEVINTISSAVDNTKNAAADNAPAQNTPAPTTPATQEADNQENDASVIVINPNDDEEVADTANPTSIQTPTAATVPAATTTPAPAPTANAPATQAPANNNSPAISAKAQEQMNKVAEYALQNNRGASKGQCFNAVWGYLTASGYGNLKAWGDLPDMGSDEARFFSEYLNRSQANLDKAGLQRFDTAFNPPITSPHDPRIPKGAVIVVGPGSYGTSHATAGDIVIKAGDGRFVNDGPNMDYGTASNWYGKLLGVYIPK